MKQLFDYAEWLNLVTAAGARDLLKETTVKSAPTTNFWYAEKHVPSRTDMIVGNWCSISGIGWVYNPMWLDKRYRHFKRVPLI